MTYNTLEELVAAVRNDHKAAKVWIDNDSITAYDPDTDETIFEMHPAILLEQALTLLGLRWEHV